jgi:lipopolysaccharide cholinephosphotransferase
MEKQEAEIRQINIKGKVVNFREQELTYKNAVIINKVTAIENLRLFATVAAKNKLKYVLAYGTLLGIIREKDLISYDIDVDASIFQEIEFLTLLPKFEQVGFDLVRFEEGILYTLKKETVYRFLCS